MWLLKLLPGSLLEWLLLAFVLAAAFAAGLARGMDAREAELLPQLEAVSRERDAWRLTAAQRQTGLDAQTALADACLKREASAQADAAEREAILALPPVPPHPTETLHENPRRAAVARYLNRPPQLCAQAPSAARGPCPGTLPGPWPFLLPQLDPAAP